MIIDMQKKFFEILSNNYLELLNDKEDFNIVINVGEFQMPRYIYGGIVVLEKIDASFIFDFMLIAFELLFEELAKHLETHLIEKEAHWLQNALISLISRNGLQMEEVKIGIMLLNGELLKIQAYHLILKNGHLKFSSFKDYFTKLLPNIRYFHMSGDDIFNYVQPYQQIITELFESFSNDINGTHAEEIVSWVDRKPIYTTRVKEPERAIGCYSSRGPVFGSGFLFFSVGNNHDKGSFYEKSSIYEKLIRNESTYDENGRPCFSVE
ncbi:hypothetical protein C2G38_2185339 [Gigaspora rosea]|uniref:Uncharacterized protein n=1 Tax=Gigaspora rosea TaxID=44941 RepID=A0A397VFR5_9GLOM|nr:hypothetical protein C2G38_2185339 [Gigaspora rosea]